MIVAFEGTDASGKQTQTKLLAENLKAHGYKTKLMGFPNYGSLTGKAILDNLKHVWTPICAEGAEPSCDRHQLSELVFQCLMTCDRYAVADEIKQYRYSTNEVLILDRYYVSGIVYGTTGGLPMEWAEAVHSSLPRADINFLLDVSLEESVRRRPDRRDRIESNLPYLKKISSGYLFYFQKMRDAGKRDHWFTVNGERHIEVIADEILAKVLWELA